MNEPETYIQIPKTSLMNWVHNIEKSMPPTIPFKRDRLEMTLDAYHHCQGLLGHLLAEIKHYLK